MAKLKVKSFPDLTAAQVKYLREIDDISESTRLRFITPGAGQAMTYEAKFREATRPDEPRPLITAEAEALEISVAEVAQTVITAHTLWQQVGSRIEALRLKAKRDIREATTVAEMHAAVKALGLSLKQI